MPKDAEGREPGTPGYTGPASSAPSAHDGIDVICDEPGCGQIISGPHAGTRALRSDFAYKSNKEKGITGGGSTLHYLDAPCAYGRCSSHDHGLGAVEATGPSQAPAREAWARHLAKQARAAEGRPVRKQSNVAATGRKRRGTFIE